MIKAALFDLDGTLYDRDALAPRLVEHFWSSYDGMCALSEDTARTLR